jgi:hypothetical protein
MVTRVDFKQAGPTAPGAFSTTLNSPNFDTQVGDFVLVFARCNQVSTEVVSSVSMNLGGALTSIGSPSPIQISGHTSAGAWYKVITTAQTNDYATATFSAGIDYRSIHVVIYRPSSGGALSFETSFGSNTTGYGLTTITTSAINTSGGVLCAFVGGSYIDFVGPTTPTSGYSSIGTSTASGLAERFSSSPLTSETMTFADANTGNLMSFAVAYLISIKEVSATYARPSSDITKQWTPSSGTDHFAMIDEVTASDADYISATAAGQTTEVKLAAMTQPQAGTSVAINYRVQGITGAAGVTVSMVQGTTVIATDANRTANGNYVLTVAPATWASVTDWTDIRLRFVST